jgi:hypothetical protein
MHDITGVGMLVAIPLPLDATVAPLLGALTAVRIREWPWRVTCA